MRPLLASQTAPAPTHTARPATDSDALGYSHGAACETDCVRLESIRAPVLSSRRSVSSSDHNLRDVARRLRAFRRAMTFQRQQLGIVGEELAARELASRGYAILERRYRTRYGEIDIVAEDGGTLVFVEVRARAGGEVGRAAESVTDGKKRKVTAMAVEYLARHHIADRPCRFDVVAIDAALSDQPEISVYPAAFDAV